MILVTGATGFVGKALIPELIRRGYDLAVLINHKIAPDDWKDKVTILKADISKKEEVFYIKDYPFDKIIHLAAYIPLKDEIREFEDCLNVNVIGTNNLLEFAAIRKIQRFIYSSSAIVYGISKEPKIVKEENSAFPITHYGMSKLLGEMLCERYRKVFGIKAVSLRYSYVYGAGMPEHFIFGKFLRKAISGEDIQIYGTGIGVRDFICVKDIVSAIILALESNVVGTFNIGTGIATSLSGLAEIIINITNSKSKIIFYNDEKEDESQPILNILKAEKKLGFQPVYNLENGIRNYVKV
ncbi:UDP-glucose 4-epimerase [bacterium BMS3Abin07]|nr:UDP-glucose 4-epimerase [bacterium BMS3Abin07]GBE32209.1 UDP-glucose 4-epimerase [bacterium BMS3Bbin05]HDO23110.1 NAD-dependent epimerase/dehydratase family protein [Nitrospirota bacterium]HDZ88567.1 NAD-dependent epimerase/dehydratase family protein [Nitrospirota bacterium]